jgi:hypothetical protein
MQAGNHGSNGATRSSNERRANLPADVCQPGDNRSTALLKAGKLIPKWIETAHVPLFVFAWLIQCACFVGFMSNLPYGRKIY